MYSEIKVIGEIPDYRPPLNNAPSRISVNIRVINRLYIHELLVI